VVITVLAATLAGSAEGAEVSVSETPGVRNLAHLEFRAETGESNRLTITSADQGDGYWLLVVRDEGAALTPGGECSGGGAPGEVVHCRMHKPTFGQFEPCGKMCAHLIPGTGWDDSFRISLGDGQNSFDGSAFAGTYTESVTMNVSSGDGEDHIVTGNGEDSIDPGAGSDEIHSGDGFDRITATAVPDGADLYDSDRMIKLSYTHRSLPVTLSGPSAGAPGEGDVLDGGLFQIVGGSGDDVLEGGPQTLVLEGGSGNDSLSGSAKSSHLYGGPGDDRLDTVRGPVEAVNHLVGEEGNDTYYGGLGSDFVREQEEHSDWGSRPEAAPTSLSNGNDVAYGGPGNDMFELRGGTDLAYGEEGNDGLHGGMEEDRLFGGASGDFVVGGSGYDRLFGGSGRDQLFSGWWKWNFPNPKRSFPFPPVHDDGPDRVDCGPDRDRAFSNPWDRLRGCEGKRLRPQAKRSGKR
jgi:Ca2+-binding RTX toxin-like protein